LCYGRCLQGRRLRHRQEAPAGLALHAKLQQRRQLRPCRSYLGFHHCSHGFLIAERLHAVQEDERHARGKDCCGEYDCRFRQFHGGGALQGQRSTVSIANALGTVCCGNALGFASTEAGTDTRIPASVPCFFEDNAASLGSLDLQTTLRKGKGKTSWLVDLRASSVEENKHLLRIPLPVSNRRLPRSRMPATVPDGHDLARRTPIIVIRGRL